jgi:hypothetical protein
MELHVAILSLAERAHRVQRQIFIFDVIVVIQDSRAFRIQMRVRQLRFFHCLNGPAEHAPVTASEILSDAIG